MAYPVSLSTLETRVYQRANMENQTAFGTNAEVVDSINVGTARWYDEITAVTFGGQLYRKTVNFNTNGNQSYYAYANIGAPDFYRLISIDVNFSVGDSTVAIPARPYQEEQRLAFRVAFPLAGWFMNSPVFYQQQGQGVNFIPLPQSQFTIGLNYAPTCPVLVNPTDTIDSWNGWEEAIVLYAAIRLAIKDRDAELVGLLKQELAEEWARIRTAASARDESPEHVHEVMTFHDPWDVY